MYDYNWSNFICTFSLFANTSELRTIKESMVMKDNGPLRLAMNEQMNTLRNNDTWDLVPMPNGWIPIRYKCVFRKKIGLDTDVILRLRR